jgi:TetR/AcrR family transcriptional regulator
MRMAVGRSDFVKPNGSRVKTGTRARSKKVPRTTASGAPDGRSRRSQQTQQQIMAAAQVEFADKGLAGARVDVISEVSGVNKQMIYYYYGSKEDLYLAVMERAYTAMRESERELNLAKLDPLAAIRKLVEFKFDYYAQHPLTIRLLAAENMQNADYLKKSTRLREMHTSLIDALRTVLKAGEKKKQVRPGIDPVQLYFSIAALSYFSFSNAPTLSAAFGRNLSDPQELRKRRAHAVELILDHIRRR